jgi:hypothetical protein
MDKPSKTLAPTEGAALAVVDRLVGTLKAYRKFGHKETERTANENRDVEVSISKGQQKKRTSWQRRTHPNI